MSTQKFDTIDSYIQTFPPNVQELLQQVRKTVQKAAPGAKEAIKYNIPTFITNRNLVHFAAYKNHIGFYPVPINNDSLKEELSAYSAGKGTAQFLISQQLPLALITKIVKYRLQQIEEKAERKKTEKTCSNGHKFLKSSDCPVCPICEKEKKSQGFLPQLAAPARRALKNNNIITIEKLSTLSVTEVLKFHGFGKASIPILQKALADEGLRFRE